MKTYCEFTFEAAHSVAPYSGLHGHTFIVKLTFGGTVDLEAREGPLPQPRRGRAQARHARFVGRLHLSR
jgi:hypothetical protein